MGEGEPAELSTTIYPPTQSPQSIIRGSEVVKEVITYITYIESWLEEMHNYIYNICIVEGQVLTYFS